jgi:hypothetical protein
MWSKRKVIRISTKYCFFWLSVFEMPRPKRSGLLLEQLQAQSIKKDRDLENFFIVQHEDGKAMKE